MKITKLFTFIISCLLLQTGICQSFDTSAYTISVESSEQINQFFTKDSIWRGADGASSIDLGNGRIVWLFSDGFICSDSSGTRKKSTITRNSVAIQKGYDLKTATVKFYWKEQSVNPQSFFGKPGKEWFWTGHGTLIKDKLIIFLMNVHEVKTGLGFEVAGWSAVLISNPQDDPLEWKMKYIDAPETFGTIAGSAAVVKDENYIYAFGAVEPSTHEAYLLRWKLNDAYNGNLAKPEWWSNGSWKIRKTMNPLPTKLFTAATEYSIHYDSSLKKFIQVQSFGFGESKIGLRLSDRLQGPWTEPYMFYTPEYTGIKRPFMYSAKAHPELTDGIYITYNINSFDFDELLANETIYFPKFVKLKVIKKSNR